MRHAAPLAFVLAALLAGCGPTDDAATSSTGTSTGTGAAYDGPRSKGAAEGYTFTQPPLLTTKPDVASERLCTPPADPEADAITIDCSVEAASFAKDTPPKDELTVVVWNIERGLKLDATIAALKEGERVPSPDILLASELDRGCSRTGGRHVAWDLAEALGMNFVFGVEFVELPREGGGGGTITDTCEHGNAILSRYPIGNVRVVRHATQQSWYDTEEPRYGGRVYVAADVLVGDAIVHAYVVHFESGGEDIRRAQSTEVAADAKARPFQMVLGGDLNAAFYRLDLTSGSSLDGATTPMLEAGLLDAHAGVPVDDRATHEPGTILDILFTNGAFTRSPGLCPLQDCLELSDHAAVWTTVELH
jgi:endonuclease/exonuclease/phosphatase family metal-dependent hydrolase